MKSLSCETTVTDKTIVFHACGYDYMIHEHEVDTHAGMQRRLLSLSNKRWFTLDEEIKFLEFAWKAQDRRSARKRGGKTTMQKPRRRVGQPGRTK
ncbi:MAG: hypothetical protein JJU36_15745 [Phycisphaeraceae bacterium]|nr:hypothetical protein [Phycisphaeraceae bacterium]